ncbi:beta-1,3-galactosyl-O-glycosyl-glycoprotein beta-1,6-N-acetylglucosaminyltransferase-like [Saccoglossus kowalevskii]|uniref:Beta-1,3-galactosyl-O-glycosyl-glycoprotein beta-1,6-N-acetylglucosaminyltransferase-like n=1 Tax=Saccoglossus kowalevskii TaxID=10224 RepID=A0ABM0GMW7_SACKO|nr:PREDICTED: beta-1,3-galactosyl-O-glycosyl-glycoprotein beta-1,6-N-acetylglucosaminyltransferase-like [Saccoglossus kowalevskii]
MINTISVQASTETNSYAKILNNGMDNINCANLINGRVENRKEVTSIAKSLASRIRNDSDYKHLTKNCTSFAHKRGYYSKPVTNEELEFPLAFGIYIYRSVYQVEQLLRIIYRYHNVYCIHIDENSSSEFKTIILSIARCFENIVLAPIFYPIKWGSMNIVRAELVCQKELLLKNKSWKYYLNVCGQDFPLKTNLEIVRILQLYGGKNDIQTSAYVDEVRAKFVYVEDEKSIENTWLIKSEPRPTAIKRIHKGSLFVALARRFVFFLQNSKISKDWLNWLNDSYIPDESFTQTLARLPNAPGGPNNHESPEMLTRYVLWNGEVKCDGYWYHDVCVFSWRHLQIYPSRHELFANKFFPDYDPIVTNCLEELLENRTNNPVQINMNMYKDFISTRVWSFREPWYL